MTNQELDSLSWLDDEINASVFNDRRHAARLLPTKPHCSSGPQMRATSAWVTGEDVIRFGESFLACGNGVDADFEHSGGIPNASTVESYFGNVLFNAGFSGLISRSEQKYPMAFTVSKAVTTFRILSVTVNKG